MQSRKIKNIKPLFIRSALYMGIMVCAQSAMALEALQDHDLRKVNGQDGVQVDLEFSEITMESAYWEDSAGTSANAEQKLKAVANNIQIDKNTAYQNGNYNLGGELKLEVGSDAANKAGMSVGLKVRPFTFSTENFQICSSMTTPNCDAAIGKLAVQSGSDLDIKLVTNDGLFNRNSQAELLLGIKNLNIFTGLNNGTANQFNQLILRNTNFNFYGKGVAYIDDKEGFVLHTNVGGIGSAKAGVNTAPNTTFGYVDLTRVADPDQTGANTGTYGGTSAGLNLEFMLKKNVTIDPTNPVYTVGLIGNNDTDTRGLIRIGASGRLVNSFMQLRGINGLDSGILGYATAASSTTGSTSTNPQSSLMGSSGIGVRLRGEFTSSGDAMLGGDNSKATKLEIGGAGTNSFGFEFSELSPLVVGSSERAYFDSGNVYLNLVNSKHLSLPVNAVLSNSRFGGTQGAVLTPTTDYTYQIHNRTQNPNSFVMSIRGAEFQALSKRGRFTSSSGILNASNSIPSTSGINNTWGLGLPFYNLNANMAVYSLNDNVDVYTLNPTTQKLVTTPSGNTQRLGLALAMSVDGKSANADRTTSIIVIDGTPDAANNNLPKNYYFGLRNIDMFLRGYGSIGFENGNLNVDLPNLLMAMSAEVAAGYLPGANASTPANSFSTKNDILFGLKLKMLGDMNFSLIPNNQIVGQTGNRLTIIGGYDLESGTAQISDPIDGSMFGLDNMSGFVEFNNAIVINKDSVGFNYSFNFNPKQQANSVFRVRDINFYPPENVNPAQTLPGQRLGEMVFTGGRLNAEMNIKPF